MIGCEDGRPQILDFGSAVVCDTHYDAVNAQTAKLYREASGTSNCRSLDNRRRKERG